MIKEKQLHIMVCCIGSGKSTLAKSMINDTTVYISQDEQGKKSHFSNFMEVLELGYDCIVDRMNFNKEQRERYIKPARERGYAINIFEFKTCPVVCFERCMKKENHPNIKANDKKTINRVIKFYNDNYEQVTSEEFDNYNLIEEFYE